MREAWRDSLAWITMDRNLPAIAGWSKKSEKLVAIDDETDVEIINERQYILHADGDKPVWSTRRAVYEKSKPHDAQIPEPLHEVDRFEGMKFKDVKAWLDSHGYIKQWPVDKKKE